MSAPWESREFPDRAGNLLYQQGYWPSLTTSATLEMLHKFIYLVNKFI